MRKGPWISTLFNSYGPGIIPHLPRSSPSIVCHLVCGLSERAKGFLKGRGAIWHTLG
ncbi:hypothetical protein BDV40DRAFT_193320 [Aspergillus tamarii]|uniref:Uncharacterized protein n=1 Tax=Aspergillus tamarii TaxID=41984 RepID=A0A5N6URS0_ASPTM|nr:hypothetical protein BDV40DRAFT_193320 [Aspergillus tamarii]